MKLKRVHFYEVMRKSQPADPEWMLALKDMLRYDLAFGHARHAGILAFPVFQTKAGNWGGIVTRDRWASFGAVLAKADPEVVTELKSTFLTDQWVTFRHPIIKESQDDAGRRDYSKLVPVRLTEFILLKDNEQI